MQGPENEAIIIIILLICPHTYDVPTQEKAVHSNVFIEFVCLF